MIVNDDYVKGGIKDILKGNIPKARLNEIMERPHHLTYNLVEKKVVTMFIDIVGFSYSSEKKGSKNIFRVIKNKIKIN